MRAGKAKSVSIIGRGAIGGPLIQALRTNQIPGHVLDRVLVRMRREQWEVEVLDGILERKPDLVIEAAGQGPARELGPAILEAGCDLMLFSVGALADPATENRLRAAVAAPNAGRLLLTTGAIGGVDILKTLCAAGPVTDVRLRSTTRPQSLVQPWMSPAQANELAAATNRVTVFAGTAREASRRFPSVANVSATLSLSSVGFDRVSVELVADPDAAAKTHEVTILSPDSTVRLCIENAFSSNPRTSRITPFAAVRWMQDQGGMCVAGV